ncbi:hypothetical protein H8E07_18300, partial [bacterium]|nr:hypothetical protein [bacterium]
MTITGSMSTSADVTAGVDLTLDGSTVNVNGVSVFSAGTGSTIVDNTPDVNITGSGHLTIFAGSGGGEPPTEGNILSYWNFDSKGGTTIADQVVDSTHAGELIAGADISTGGQGFGGEGEALQLSAEGDYMDVLDPTTYNFSEAYTWTARIKTTDGSGAVFSRNPNGTAWNQGSQALFVRGNTAQFDSGWVSNPQTGTAVQDDAWHQLVVTFNPTGDVFKIYVDGLEKYPGPFNANAYDEATTNHNGGFANTSFTIGKADFSGGLASLDTLIGLIDDAAIFDTALTGDDLTRLFTEGARSFAGSDAKFGDLTMTSGAQLTLDSDDGLGTGGASFNSITGGGTIRGAVTAAGTVNPNTIIVEGDLIVGAASTTTWEIGDLIDVNAGVGMAGDVTLEDGFTLSINEAVAPDFGVVYPVIEFEGSLTLGRTPAGLSGTVTNGVVNNIGGGDWGSTSMWYNSSRVFIVASAERTWNGSLSGTWSSNNWLPAVPSGPTQFGIMAVNAGTVTVDAPYTDMSGPFSLAIGGGTVEVANNLDVTGSTSVSSGVLNVSAPMQSGSLGVSGGSVTARAGGTLTSNSTLDVTAGTVTSAAGGAINATTVNVSGTGSLTADGGLTATTVNLTGGTASFGDGATLTVSELNVSGAVVNSAADMANVDALNISSGTVSSTGVSGLGSVDIKDGGAMDNSAALTVAGDASFGGVLTTSDDITVAGTMALGGTVNSNGTVVLSGDKVNGMGADLNVDGNLTINSGIVLGLTFNQLNFGFHDGFIATDLDFDNGIDGDGVDGGVLAKVPALHASWPAYFQTVAGPDGIATGPLPYAGSPSDTYTAAWDGFFIPPETKSYSFRVHGDDWEALWIDTDLDGEFDLATDLISDNRQPSGEGWNTPHVETVTLTAGVPYRFAIGETENGGGDFLEFSVDGVDVNPSAPAQAGWWATGSGIPLYGTISLTNASTVDLGAPSRVNSIVTAGATAGITGDVTVGQDISLNGNKAAGQLDVTGNFAMASGSNFNWDTAGDTVNVSAELNLENPFNVVLQPSGVVNTAVDYDLFTYNTIVGVPGDNFTLLAGGPYAELLDLDPLNSYVSDDTFGTVTLHLTGIVDTATWKDAGSDAWASDANWDGPSAPGGAVAAIVDSSENFDAKVTLDATAHTLIIDKAPGAVTGGKVVVNAPGNALLINNNTHVMAGGTLDVQAGTFHSVGDTTVYSGGTLDVQGEIILSDEKNLVTAGATTFGATASLSLNVIGGLPEDVKGNL